MSKPLINGARLMRCSLTLAGWALLLTLLGLTAAGSVALVAGFLTGWLLGLVSATLLTGVICATISSFALNLTLTFLTFQSAQRAITSYRNYEPELTSRTILLEMSLIITSSVRRGSSA